MPDNGLLAALETAVAAAPEDVELRMHLAGLLCDAGEGARALAHVARVLAQTPGHREALNIAVRAAEISGLPDVAATYRAQLVALDPVRPAGSDELVAEASDGGVPEADEFDEFLRQVVEEAADDAERPTVTLADVGGLEDVKRRLELSFLSPIRKPKLRRMYGTSLRGGLLMYGPPGCGKTFLARAVAGELGARFFAIGLHDVLDMWLGKSEQNLHEVFETARRNTPCILFLDEVDALGMKRSNLTRSAGRNVVAQLLTEMDSTNNNNDGVFVLGATNQPWDLDPALRRPGRFDRTLLVLPPDLDARVAILSYHLRARPVGDVALDAFARRTDGFSGADLRLVVESAAERAFEDSVTTGDVRPIGQSDLVAALGDVDPSVKPWFAAARSFVMFSNQAGAYDDLAAYMREHRLL